MRILYSTNGSDPAHSAGRLLRQLMASAGHQVTVSVCDSVEFAFPEEPWRFGEVKRPRARPKEVVDAEAEAFEAEGIVADRHLGSGVPAEQILDLVREGRYDLTALGAGSTNWLENLLLGSTATRVLHGSETSVLVVHRFEEHEAKLGVLLATDGSPDADFAIDTLIELADPKKVVVKVVSVSSPFPRVAPLYRGFVAPPEVVGELKELAQDSVGRAAEPLKRAGFTVDTACPVGEPVREILELARYADLVVVGSRGRGAASRLLMGSVSDQVSRLAPATLVCRRLGDGPDAGS